MKFEVGQKVETPLGVGLVGAIDKDLKGNTLIAVNISTTDRYFPSFTDVIYAGTIPADAVNLIERPDPSSRN